MLWLKPHILIHSNLYYSFQFQLPVQQAFPSLTCTYTQCTQYTCVHTHIHTDSGEYSTVEEANALLGKSIHSKEVILEDKIGEGQFGDVHKGVLYPDVSVHPLLEHR